jgi:methylglutaconyl-CoA hydratase
MIRIEEPAHNLPSRVAAPVVIRLARPEQRNALTPEMLGEFVHAIDRFDREERAVVVAGDGEVFCAGFDLRLCQQDPDAMSELLKRLAGTIARMRAAHAPIVIAAHGAAIAGGCALLGGADFVVTNAGAKLGYPVVKLGLSPAVSAPFLRTAVTDGECRERLLDPALISGAEALRVGLVHECVAGAEEVMPAALRAAANLASKPSQGFSATKNWLAEIERESFASLGTDPVTAARSALEVSLATARSAECRDRIGALKFSAQPRT